LAVPIGSIDIKMTWEDPLGAANDGNCVGGGGGSLSIVANRFVLQTTTDPFTYIRRVRWKFWPPLPPGTEFMLNTSINVVGGRTTPITDQTVITAE
jgi:hypothetical protein